MNAVATQLKFRLDQRLRWFHNEWFFKWHHIGGQHVVAIDTFDGRQARYTGIKFSGSARDVFWDSIARGVRKEVLEQFAWIEERVRAYPSVQAEAAIDECARLLSNFAQSVRRAAVQKDSVLRGDGLKFPPEQDAGRWVDVSPCDMVRHATALKAVLLSPATPQVEARAAGDEAKMNTASPKYQVALSFAGEQREYVEAVAYRLKQCGIEVFYDRFEMANLWGKDGAEFFHQIFGTETNYVVMFISNDYIRKKWTRLERRSALSQAIGREGEYVLPVRFDDSIVPGLPDTVQYVRAADYEPAELAALISEKIGLAPRR